MRSVAILSAILSCRGAPVATGPHEVSRINLPKVAYANVIDQSLYLSTFDGTPIFGKDYEYVIRNASSLLAANTKVSPEKLKGSITWPNGAAKAPKSLFGTEGGGFLVPGKGNGGIWFGKPDGTLLKLFAASNFFYHHVEFYDVNQDGNMDILTCRAFKGFVGGGHGDLTWLQPVDRKAPLGKWKETVIGKGCDTYFLLADVNNDGKIDLVAAEFWGQKMSITESVSGRFDDASLLNYTVIDSTSGSMFSLQLADINGDGKNEILASNHDESGNGGVFAYEIPSVASGNWKRHDLATVFPVLQKGIAQAAPGAAEAFYPTPDSTGAPHIVVAGDGSQQAYILVPTSNPWSYDRTLLHNCGCTVGGIAVGDVNGDGKKELYIPCYDSGYLVTYSF